jgi:CDP-6-deoxy-D-xylo-4-hexulose-3-dehydrase
VEDFERAFAAYVGAPHAVMTNSGSSADLLCALGLGRAAPHRDQVLVPAVTWPTQVWACVLAGYRVRLVDVNPATLQLDLDDLERKANPNTRAIFAAHILGNVGDMARLTGLAAELGVPVLEDCCEALGARWRGRHVGTFGSGTGGTAGAFSFFFSHVLSTMEGGMVVTDSPMAARRSRLWRTHGWEPRPGDHFHFPEWGMNVRPTEVQGAFGGVQLARLDGFLAARARNFARLDDQTARRYPDLLSVPAVLPGCQPAWHAFPLLVANGAPFTRDALCAYLEACGVETRPVVAGNLARQPSVARHPRVLSGDLPGADAVDRRGFYLGLASEDDEAGTAYVGEVLRGFVEGRERA